jgi:hypothetical protein
MVIWYIFPRFGKLHQEKSGSPVSNSSFPFSSSLSLVLSPQGEVDVCEADLETGYLLS